MSIITPEKFKRICDGVWRDRDAILTRHGGLSCEAALVRAVYWRLCKSWAESGKSIDDCYTGNMLLVYRQLVGDMLTQHAGPHFDGAPLLDELIRQYREEAGQIGRELRELKTRSV